MNQLLDAIASLRELTGRPVGVKTALGGWEFMQQLCDGVLLLCYSRGREVVDASEIDEVARDMGLIERAKDGESTAAASGPHKGRWRSRLRSIFR